MELTTLVDSPILKRCLNVWSKEQERWKPAGFPKLWVKLVKRVYPVLPLEVEQDIHGLWAVQNLLDNPKLEENYWNKMRKGDYRRIPTEVTATFFPDGYCTTDLKFN